MNDPIDTIIFDAELSDEQAAELRRLLASDEELAAVFRRWRALRAAIRSEIDEAIGDRHVFTLFALYRGGFADQLSREEQDLIASNAGRLEAVLAEHPGLEAAAEEIVASASTFSDIWNEHLGADAGPARAGDRAARHPRATSASRRRSPARWAIRAAIGVAVVIFAFILTQLSQRDSNRITVETAGDETQLIELGDGSRVRLLGSSSLTYVDPASATVLDRKASLDGRAYFEISPEGRGFIVTTSMARVTVLGTSFGLEADERLTEVVLTDGRLTLSSRDDVDDLVVLEPGQMSRVAENGRPTEPVDIDLHEYLGWTGLFVFKSATLAEIAERLSTHFETAIIVEEPLASERVTGTFEQDQPLRDILDVLASAVGANVRTHPTGGYVVSDS